MSVLGHVLVRFRRRRAQEIGRTIQSIRFVHYQPRELFDRSADHRRGQPENIRKGQGIPNQRASRRKRL